MEYKKELPLGQPLLKTWASNSHLHAIISATPDSYEWVMNNFVQMFGFIFTHRGVSYPPNFHFMSLHNPFSLYYPGNAWDLCPFILKNSLDRDTLIRRYSSFVEFVIDMIDHENYVCVYLERVFGKSKLDPAHFSLVYGYDLASKEIYLADHFDEGRYGYFKIPFDVIENAYMAVDSIMDSGAIDLERVLEVGCVYFVKRRSASYQFDIGLFRYDLKEYLSSSDNSGFIGKRARFYNCYENYKFGISTYQLLIDHLKSLTEGGQDDWRIMTFFKDHKELMLLRLQYMAEQGYVASNDKVEDWKVISDSFNVLLGMYIKFAISRNVKILHKMIPRVAELQRMEKEILESIL